MRPICLASALALVVCAPTVAGAQARLTVSRSEILRRLAHDSTAGDIRVVRRTRVDTMATEGDSAALRPGDVVVVPTGHSATSGSALGGEPHLDLPSQYLVVNRAGTALLSLTIRISLQGGGLRYDPATQRFQGTVLVGLEDTEHLDQQVTLPRAIELEVTADAEIVEPGTLTIGHTNIPFVPVRIRVHDPGDTVELHIRAVFDPKGHRAPIPVRRPEIVVEPSPPRIQGFGLETATLTFTPPAALSDHPVTLALSATRGRLDTTSLVVVGGAVGVTRIRSTGLGPARVRARSGSVALGQTELTFGFPWPFLIATLLGGLIGAALRARRRRAEPRRARSFALDLLFGALTGVVVAVAYALGVNFLGFELSVWVGEGAVWLVATLGALYGLPSSLAGLWKRLRPAGAAVLLVSLLGGAGCTAIGRAAAQGVYQRRDKLAEAVRPVARAAVEEAGRAFEDSVASRVAALTAALRDSVELASGALLDSVEARVARMRDSVGGVVELWAARAGGAADRSLRLALAATLDSLAAGLEPEGDVGGALVRLGDRVVRQAVRAISDQSRRSTPWWIWAGGGLLAASALAAIGTFILRFRRRAGALRALGRAIQEHGDPALANRVKQIASERGVEPWLHRYLEAERLLVPGNSSPGAHS